MAAHVFSGLDNLREADRPLRGRRIGLMTNPTGIDRDFQTAIDLLNRQYRLTALFACGHGLRGDRQAGEAVESYDDARTGVRVHSLYGRTRRLTREMTDVFVDADAGWCVDDVFEGNFASTCIVA